MLHGNKMDTPSIMSTGSAASGLYSSSLEHSDFSGLEGLSAVLAAHTQWTFSTSQNQGNYKNSGLQSVSLSDSGSDRSSDGEDSEDMEEEDMVEEEDKEHNDLSDESDSDNYQACQHTHPSPLTMKSSSVRSINQDTFSLNRPSLVHTKHHTHRTSLSTSSRESSSAHSRNSDSSCDDDEDDDDSEDSQSTGSDSESSLEANSGSDSDTNEHSEDNSDGHIHKAASAHWSHTPSPIISAGCSLQNMEENKPSGSPIVAMTNLEVPKDYNSAESLTTTTLSGAVRRKRVTDEKALRLPLDFGWQRVTRVRAVTGRLLGEVCYYAPCGKKLRQYADVMKYLHRNNINEIRRENFSFSTKIKLGHFYKAREGPEGVQWVLLSSEEVTPCISAMNSRQQKKTTVDSTEHKDLPQDVTDAMLLRKLEAQVIARQIAEMKMMKKLEKQALAQAAKEAKKQQAMLAAEERQKRKEQMKILKEQEKMVRIQQVRLEKEVRAQQILQAKRRKKEEAANAKLLKADKRSKEKEMRKLHSVFLKHQEKEKRKQDLIHLKTEEAHRRAEEKEKRKQDLIHLKTEEAHRRAEEKEKRKQDLILLKTEEAQKKAEEKERLRKERKDEERLNKEKRRELRGLELEKTKELKQPTEDLCLPDHQPLPELCGVPGLVLSAETFSELLMLLQFIHSFGKVLRLTPLSLRGLQEGLLNVEDSVDRLQDLLVNMVSAAVKDHSLSQGYKNKTSSGPLLSDVEMNRENVSEVLRLYMETHCEQSPLSALMVSLRTTDFRALHPHQKTSILAYLVNELCCSKAVVSEIDRNIDHMTNLRKEKWIVEGQLRKLRSIFAKKTGKRDVSVPTSENSSKRKEGENEEGEEEGHKAKKTSEHKDEREDCVSVDELEKQIEKATKQQSEIRQKLVESSHCLRSMMIGLDRYRRSYWLLPQCGGVFVEGARGDEELSGEDKQTPLAVASGNSPTSAIHQQFQSGTHQCDMSSELKSPGLPFSGSSVPPMRELPPQQAQCGEDTVLFQATSSSVSEAEAPEPPSAWLPADDRAHTQDPSSPQGIPQDMLKGWWWMSSVEEVQNLSKALHCRGVRERNLSKQIHKHMQHMTQSRHVLDGTTLQQHNVSKEMVDKWCVQEQALKWDISVLKSVEALERRVMSAGLQVKGWTPPEPLSLCEGSSCVDSEERRWPLEAAVSRLGQLERNLEWRGEEEDAQWRKLWVRALSEVHSPAQLSMCVQQLHKHLPWHHTVTRVSTAGSVIQEKVPSQRTRRQQTQTSEGEKKSREDKANSIELRPESTSRGSRAPQKRINKRKADEERSGSENKHDNHEYKKAKMSRDDLNDEIEICRLLLDELEAHHDVWPFLKPVALRSVPGYKKVIKKPMDLSSIRQKFSNKQYLHLESFIADVNLIFENCEKFNEDNSEIGRAGHNMRRFFQMRLTELAK